MSKINQLLRHVVSGTAITSRFLREMGVSKELARTYVDSGWLTRIGRGAFVRSGDAVEWPGAVYALQSQLKMSTHVGGLSALELRGMGHYLQLGNGKLTLVSDRAEERLPAWFKNNNWGVVIEHLIMRLFEPEYHGGMRTQAYQGIEIVAASPERASMEMLYQVVSNSDFDAARQVFDGLPSLRPKSVQELLEVCRSVRVKRMFLWMAKDCGHPWTKYLDPARIDLGVGKRLIYSKGKLDKDLLITVPKDRDKNDV